MEVGILSYKKLKGGHFYVETSNGCYYVKDTRKDIGDDYSCRLCCEVFQGVKKSSEASNIAIIRSASFTNSLDFSIPIFSTSFVAFLIPAVSII